MSENISVLLVDDISSTIDNLRKLLSFEDDIDVIGTAANGREAVEEAKRLRPAIVLMDVNMPEMDGIKATELMASEAPNSPVIIMSVQGERDYLRRAMQSGAREFLIKPFSGDELVASIRRVYQLEQRKETYARSAQLEAARPDGGDAAVARASPPEAPASTKAPAPAMADQAEAAEAAAAAPAPALDPAIPEKVAAAPRTPARGELIVLFGGKGGVGKSVIGVNLACALAKEMGARVALVDLDLQFGDVGVLLNLPQTQTITDVVENMESMDEEFLRDLMAVGPVDVRVLTTPPSPELADLVTPDHVQYILGHLRNLFDFIVVDTSSHLGDITLTALDMATHIMLVTGLSIPSIKNAKLALRLFETLSIPAERVSVVLNRCEAHTEFNKDSIEAHLKVPITIQLPHDPRIVINSINRGLPFVIANPEAEASQRMRQMVGILQPDRAHGETADPAKNRRRFGRR
ncbi:MAG: response regulator [Candidatus Dormibacteria bacterium]